VSIAHWKTFLTRFSLDLLERLEQDQYEQLHNDVKASKWMGFAGATMVEIRHAEACVGSRLPQSYREFLSVTNGWRRVDNFVDGLWPVNEVDWLRSKNQSIVDAWVGPVAGGEMPDIPDEEYLTYGPTQDPARLRVEYLQSALEIGWGQDSVFLLLNPEIVSERGEWEAWFLAHWLPGAQRFRSFEQMMHGLHDQFVDSFPKLRDA